MANLYNLARMTTATTGTGTVTLGSAVSGFLSFANAGVPDGREVTYGIRDGANSEIGLGTYTSSGTTLSRTTILNSTNGGSAISLSGNAQVFITASCQDLLATTRLANSFGLVNGELSAAVGSNALTISLKTRSGSDPSATDSAYVLFRSSTASSGSFAATAVTAATSITVSSGSTLGTSNSTPFRLWIVGFDDAGTFRLGVINCRSGLTVYPLDSQGIASSTAEGGAGGADSALVFYTGTAVTSKSYTVLGYVTYESGLATAGTWSSTPTVVRLFGYGSRLPGERIQQNSAFTGAVVTGTTTVPQDDTVPQNTEGDEYMTCGITPTSAANLLHINTKAHLRNSNGSTGTFIVSLFQDSTANALSTTHAVTAIGTLMPFDIHHEMLSATTSATTFKLRAGSTVAGTTTFNGNAGGRLFGGVYNSFLRVEELMA